METKAMKPLISIVVPVFNVEKFLTECVNSIQSQTLEEIEIILVDDGSTDRSSKMCDEFAAHDTRTKVIHKQNEGLGLTRNTGIAHSCGEFIMFVDSDDFIEPNTCEHLYHLMLKNELDVIYYRYQQFTTSTEICSSHFGSCRCYDKLQIKNLMLDMIASQPSEKNDSTIACSAATALYRKSIINQHLLTFQNERILISEDLIFNLDFLNHTTKAGINDSVLYHYRVNPSSITHTIKEDRILRNRTFYQYLLDNAQKWDLKQDQLQERIDRLFIGMNRFPTCIFLSSSLKIHKKNDFFNTLTKDPLWTEIGARYPWQSLPTFQRLFFVACLHRKFFLALLLSYSKKFLAKKQ